LETIEINQETIVLPISAGTGQIGWRIVNQGKIVYFLKEVAVEKENLGE
jgi:hypothetical protein